MIAADPCPLADRLGCMTPEGGLFPHLTAGENVVRLGQVRGLPRAELAHRLDELMLLRAQRPVPALNLIAGDS